MKKGFTLVELLAVIVIIGVVALIGGVSIGAVRESITTMNFSNRLSEIVQTAKLYGEDNKSNLPTVKSIEDLINNNYVEALETYDDKAAVLNPFTGLPVNEVTIRIYKENNRVYACIEDSDQNKTYLSDSEKEKYSSLYC